MRESSWRTACRTTSDGSYSIRAPERTARIEVVDLLARRPRLLRAEAEALVERADALRRRSRRRKIVNEIARFQRLSSVSDRGVGLPRCRRACRRRPPLVRSGRRGRGSREARRRRARGAQADRCSRRRGTRRGLRRRARGPRCAHARARARSADATNSEPPSVSDLRDALVLVLVDDDHAYGR